MFTSLRGFKVGGSFTGLTVSRKLVRAVAPSASVTFTVIVALPNWLVSGRTPKVRLAPLSP